MFPVEHPDKPDAFFMPLTSTWGWATWQRAWKIFDWNATGSEEMLRNARERKRFDLDGAYPYSLMLENRLAGENDSWGILWCWAVFKAGGLVLHPRESLVWNGGFDGTGTHCSDSDAALPVVPNRVLSARLGEPLKLPEVVKADAAAFGSVKEFLRRQQGQASLSVRLRERVARLWR
jgi:hypothetical protein